MRQVVHLREFTQDDAHIFSTSSQLEKEIIDTVKLILNIYNDFGFNDVEIYLSTRPEKRIGTEEIWDLSEQVLQNALTKNGYNFKIMPGEGAFYGPKLEFHLKDALGRKWQCGTVQVDMNLPERFDISYVNESNQKERPIMIHRALFGSIERFLGILIEQHAGHLPFWLSPSQIVIAKINESVTDYANDIMNKLKSCGLNVSVDNRNEKIGYKVREHSVAKVNIILTIGDKEKSENMITFRELGENENKKMSLDEFIKYVCNLSQMPSMGM